MAGFEAAARPPRTHADGAHADLRLALVRAAQDCQGVPNDERPGADPGVDSLPAARRWEAARIIAGWDGYRPTPLVGFPETARALGLASLDMSN